jgi:RNA polymerase sigma-70 factor (ECF subfamily)
MLRDPVEAQDVAQEALVKLWRHRAEIDGEGAPFWLRRTTHNLCVDRLRRRLARREPGVEPLESLLPDPAHGPLRQMQSGELGLQIERALGRLGVRDRAVIVLREVQGLAYDDIARMLHLPLGTVKARLHRARERLRAELLRAGARS